MSLRTIKKFSIIFFLYCSGIFVILLASSVLIGWCTRTDWLLQIYPYFQPMQYNTALGFLLCGFGLIFIIERPSISGLFGLVVAFLGGLTLIQYIFTINIGIDEFFIKPYLTIQSTYPGRPAPNTALCFLLIGLILFSQIPIFKFRVKDLLTFVISLFIAAVGSVALFGYLASIPTAYGWGQWTGMAINTSFGFTLIGLALSTYFWQVGRIGDYKNNIILPISIFVFGSLFFILLWQALIAQQHRKAEQDVRREIKYLAQAFAMRLNEYLSALKRLQSRFLLQSQNNLLWKVDIQNYLHDFKYLIAIAITDQDGQLLEKLNQVGVSPSIIDLNLKECSQDFKSRHIASESTFILDNEKKYICSVFTTDRNANGKMLYAIIDISQLIHEISNQILTRGYELELTVGNQVLYSRSNYSSQFIKDWRQEFYVTLGDISMRLKLWPDAAIIQEYSSYFPIINFISGLIITLLLALLLRFLQVEKYYRKLALQEREKSIAIIENAPDAIVVSNQQGNIVVVNAQAEKLFAYTRSELIGEKIEILIPEPYKSRHEEHRLAYNQVPRVRPMGIGMELYGLRKNGERFPVEISLSPLAIENDLLVLASVRDISERKKIEYARDMLSSIVQSSDDAIIGKDLNGKIVSWNRGAELLYGYSSIEAIGKNISFIHPLENKNEFNKQWKKIKEGVSIRIDDTRRIRKDGRDIPVSITISPIKNAQGKVIGASTIARDITELEKHEEALNMKNLELENANLSKDRFLASMSHELRTPLNAIIGFTGTLLMKLPGPLNAEQEKQLKTVETSAKHLLSIINDILDVARIKSGKIELNFEEVNCKEVVTEVISTFAPIAKLKNINLKSDIPDIDIFATTDRRALTQILINLVNNAIKFTDEGYVEIKMSCKEINKNEFVVVDILDTGIGIKKEDNEKLFKSFERIESGDYKEGTGLGLYLSKKLLGLMKGNIEFESEYGKGSRFSILIPKKSKRGKND